MVLLQVLACSIVAVFLAGTSRLWWTNRATRRLEVIDEEKRARMSEMRHCGITTRQADGIPFGVRALQSGLEVDGIWVSRTHLPELSQVASSATLMGDQDGRPKGKDKVDSSSHSSTRQRYTSEVSTIDQVLQPQQVVHDPPATESQASAECGIPPRMTPDRPQHQNTAEVWSYLPTGWQEPERPSQPENPLPSTPEYLLPLQPSPAVTPSKIATASAAPKSVPSFGTGEVHVNTATRKPNKNFEIFPAGALGPRSELSGTDPSHDDQEIRLPRFQPGPAKLRKKRAPKGGDVI